MKASCRTGITAPVPTLACDERPCPAPVAYRPPGTRAACDAAAPGARMAGGHLAGAALVTPRRRAAGVLPESFGRSRG